MTRTLIAGLAAAVLLTGSAVAQNNNPNAPGHDRVCLITFNKANTEANVDVVRARLLPRQGASAQVNDLNRIYEYGPGGSLTQETCDCLNNPATRADCSQPLRTD